MSTSGQRPCIPAPLLALLTAACLLVIAGCSNDDDPSIDSSAPAATSPATSDIATSETDDIPLTSEVTSGTADIVIPPPADSSDIALPPPVVSSDIPASVIIEAIVGVDTGPDRVERVPLGSNVVLSVTNPTSDDEFHLHGYELGDAVVMPAGQPETFSFLADQAGEFELESHETGDVLLVLSVN